MGAGCGILHSPTTVQVEDVLPGFIIGLSEFCRFRFFDNSNNSLAKLAGSGHASTNRKGGLCLCPPRRDLRIPSAAWLRRWTCPRHINPVAQISQGEIRPRSGGGRAALSSGVSRLQRAGRDQTICHRRVYSRILIGARWRALV